jgi:hypothetical protein
MKKQFVTDADGKNVAVLLPLKDYNKLLDDQDELNCIRAFDRAKAKRNKKFISAQEMFYKIAKKRKLAAHVNEVHRLKSSISERI